MIIREEYLNKIIKLKDKDIIKVITGIRRSGKSVLLNQFKDYLINSGVNEQNIIYINFELLDFSELLDYKKMYEYILSNTKDGKMYLLIDEIQEVDYFEKAIDSLFAKGNYDIYITGSNSHLLSSEISTVLSGRNVQIEVLPFSFKEFYSFVGGDVKDAFNKYYKYGGLPYICQMDDDNSKLIYLEGIYNTIVIKDLVERKKVLDVKLLKDVLKYIIDTIGNNVSTKKIADALTSSGRKTSHITVGNYIDYLEESYIIYKAERYDIRGKQRLSSLEKYYIVDLGFRSLALGDRQYNTGSVLENIVFLELIRRGYKVSIGKIDNLEIDFIATKSDEKKYFQVAASVLDPSTFERETKPFLKVQDSYEKVILTLDELPMNYEGIKQKNIIEWLLNK